jgi:hypothetical protein
MQYLLLLHIDESDWPTMTPDQQAARVDAYRAFTENLTKSGAMVTSARLRPAEAGRTVQTKGGRTVAMDGPFAETKEQIAGFYLIEAADYAAAEAWAAKCPSSQHGAVEVRELWPMPAPVAA